MEPIEILNTAVKVLDQKKAVDIKAIKVEDITILADYFVMATGMSSTQVKALAEEIEFKLSQQGVEPLHIEGRTSGWILLDYGTVLIHVFYKTDREFYGLDHLWQDAEQVDISSLLTD